MSEDNLAEIIEVLEELKEDNTVPRNVRARIASAVEMLKSSEDITLKVDKALQELDEIANDTNTQPYTRTQIWNIVSMLESSLLLF